MFLNAKVKARQKTLNAVVKFVTVVSCADVENELLTLSEEDRIDAKTIPKTYEEDWSLDTNSWNQAVMLTPWAVCKAAGETHR